MAKLSRMAAIVGVDESDEIGKVPNKSRLQHGSEAAFNALDDAGLSLSDVDGLFVAGPSPYNMAEYMGFTPKYTDGTNVGRLLFRHLRRARPCRHQRRAYRRSPHRARRSGTEHPGLRWGRPQTCPSPSMNTPTAWSSSLTPTPWPAHATCTSSARNALATPSQR